MNPLRAPEKGEVLKLGPPLSGEVVVVVDPGSAGAAFAAGTQTLVPGAEIPVHKHLERDQVLFIHKGQGRATLNERVINVVPGAMLHVPRGAWHGLRNTGTGALQIAWASSPPGLEAFFRDCSRLAGSPTASGQALQELAQRHGIEFRQATDAPPMPEGRRHRGRRGGRGRGRRGPIRSGASGSAVTPSSARVEPRSTVPSAPGISTASSTIPSAPAASGAPSGHRRRRGAPHASSPVPTPASSPSGPGRQRSARGYRRGRVKEVYMGGRWVRVEGEGPVIAPGRQPDRGPKRGEDDEPPPIRLSVPL